MLGNIRYLQLRLQIHFGIMNEQTISQSLLTPTSLALDSAAKIAVSDALVAAPHPDDETLGCGGAIALLRSLGCNLRVLVISDGTLSHPHSRQYPAPKLRALRETESLSALAILGVEATAVTFLRLPDGSIPTSGTKFEQAVSSCDDYLAKFVPQIIFLPWRGDPHADHRATWQLIHTAVAKLRRSPRLIEYPIWDWDSNQRTNLPFAKVISWRLDISSVLDLKLQAIAAYRSQITDLISDDPQGFRLTPEMLANFSQPWEVYLEET